MNSCPTVFCIILSKTYLETFFCKIMIVQWPLCWLLLIFRYCCTLINHCENVQGSIYVVVSTLW